MYLCFQCILKVKLLIFPLERPATCHNDKRGSLEETIDMDLVQNIASMELWKKAHIDDR